MHFGWCYKLADRPRQHQAINDDILKGRFPKQRCGEDQQGVEPTGTEHKVSTAVWLRS